MPSFSCHLLTFISFRRGLRHDKCIVATQHFCGVSTTEVTSFVVLNAPAASWQTWLFLLLTNPSPPPNRILILSVKYVSVLGARGRQQKQQTSFPTNVILKQISPKLNISHIGTFNKAFFHFKYVSTKLIKKYGSWHRNRHSDPSSSLSSIWFRFNRFNIFFL
jgi:hypothetical protein